MIGFAYWIIGYLFGTFQTSYLISNFFKKEDIRSKGNGNAGASNATIVYGWKYGIIIALTDILKAYLAIVITRAILPPSELGLALCALGAFLGHCYPFYMGFRGGKGTACIIGILMAMGWIPFIVGIIVIVAITFLTNYIAVGTFFLTLVLIGFSYYHNFSLTAMGIIALIAILSLSFHIKNYIRIYKGTETKLSHTLKKQ